MNTKVFATTLVVKQCDHDAVDHGTHAVQYLFVATLKDRLRQIVDEGRVVSERAWSDAADLAPGAVNKLLAREGADEGRVELRTINRLAAVAGVSPAWLAYGVGGPDEDPPIGTILLEMRRLPGLEPVINRNPQRWRVSTLVRAMSATFQSDSDGVPIGGWEKALDGIESGRAGRTQGDAAAVTRATRRQTGRRPRLPREA